MTPSVPRETLLRTALSAIESYNTWDIARILAPRAADCLQYVSPARLRQPPMSNEAYTRFFAATKSQYRNFRVQVLNTVVDVEKRVVVAYAKSEADTELGKYRNEYVFTLEMDESGEKVKRVEEFVDTWASRMTVKLGERARGKL